MGLRIEGFQRSATRSVWSPGVSFKRQTRPLDEPTMYKFCFIKLLYGKCNSLKSDGMRKILSFSFVSQEHGNCVREKPTCSPGVWKNGCEGMGHWKRAE